MHSNFEHDISFNHTERSIVITSISSLTKNYIQKQFISLPLRGLDSTSVQCPWQIQNPLVSVILTLGSATITVRMNIR